MWGGNYWGRPYWPAEYWGPNGGFYTASGCASPGGFGVISPAYIRVSLGGIGLLPAIAGASRGGIATLPTAKLVSLGGFADVQINRELAVLGGFAIIDRDMC